MGFKILGSIPVLNSWLCNFAQRLQTFGINSKVEATELLGGQNEITRIERLAHGTRSTDVRLKRNVGLGSRKVLPERGRILLGLRK